MIEDRLVTLADMTCPILAFVGENDEIAPARSVRAARLGGAAVGTSTRSR